MGKPCFQVGKKLEKQHHLPPASSSRKPQWYHHSTRTPAWTPSSAVGSKAQRGAGAMHPARRSRVRRAGLIAKSVPRRFVDTNRRRPLWRRGGSMMINGLLLLAQVDAPRVDSVVPAAKQPHEGN